MLSVVATVIGTGVLGLSGLLLAATPASPDWISYLLNGGPFAIVVVLLILDKLTTPFERDRLRQENLQLREEIKMLNQNVREEVVPPLVQINSLMKEVIEELSRNRHYPPESGNSRR